MKKVLALLLITIMFSSVSIIPFSSIISFLVPSNLSFADENKCANISSMSEAEIERCLSELTTALNMSVNATRPLESQLRSLQTQINQIKQRVMVIEQDVVIKKKNIDEGYKNLAKQEEILSRTVRDFYIKSYYNSPLLIFLSAPSASQITQVLAYQKAATDQDKMIITNISLSITDLETKKKNLENEQIRLASLKANLDEQSAKLDKIVSGAKAYQSSLSGQIAQLSAKQQAIIAAKQSALSSAAGKSLDTQTSTPACPPQAISYPSNIRVKFSDGHVESMSFEDQYLKGLGEMPRAWSSENNSQEAFKAQVVAARAYALYKIVRSSCRDFDVYSSTADQVYNGNTGDSNWNNAVEATKGQFLQNGGNVIIAYYSANAGGHTLSPQEAWNGGGGYPGGVDDMGPDGKPNSDLNSRCIGTLRWEYHYNVGRNGKIQYNDTCPGGDIANNNSPMTSSEVEDIVDATTWALKNGNVPDNSMNHDQIKNDLGADAVGEIQSISTSIADNKYTSNLHVTGTNRTIDFAGDQAQTFRLVFNVRSPDQFLIPSTTYGAHFVKYDVLSASDAHGTQGTGWYFYTYGYGHRIGLDQEGALGMANQGKSYTDILSHYYQGATITPQGYSGSVQ